MRTAIEQVVTSDEAARETVADARREAESLVRRAKEEAETIIESGRDRLARIEQDEIEPIIAEAEKGAEEKLARTEQYIGRLIDGVAAKEDRILEEFLSLVLGTVTPSGDEKT